VVNIVFFNDIITFIQINRRYFLKNNIFFNIFSIMKKSVIKLRGEHFFDCKWIIEEQ
jgi:hypothetical protein